MTLEGGLATMQRSSAWAVSGVSYSWSVAERETIQRQARLSTDAPRIPWDKFLRDVLDWKAGEHFGLVGPTGLGKTTMMCNLLPLHPYVVVTGTKPADETMDYLINSEGYLLIDRWRSLGANQFPRRVLWPDARSLSSATTQAEVFHSAFERIYREGHWTLAIDETWYMDQILGLRTDIKMFLLQARSLGISLLCGTQRPAWVPRELYTSCTHLMFWRTNDDDDLRSLAGIGWKDAKLIREAVANLDKYQALYINTRTGYMCRTRCPEVQAA